ncbi:MAG TPA: hypothetical protein PKD55_01055 [Bellilinea sp.]|nr:hypothetical protein [Bellilinea sp.]
MGFTWQVSPEDVFPEMSDQYAAAVTRAVRVLAARYAPEIEAWMKSNAPWTDRTGNARQTLHSEVEELASLTIIWFRHGVEYGKYLELSHGGRWAVIGPALDHFAPLIWRDVMALVR